MSPPRTDLAPPKDDPITLDELKQFDGSQPGKPIYLAIKGTVFDVSDKPHIYGPTGSYHIFAGKDGSRGLGKSSLKPEDAVSDWSTLEDSEIKVLNQWYDFFSKRYNIVGKVV
ncbi:cytochrome b5-like heme/steroid binding domain-containing protein [Cantharellus anzutake]|uniref:cytochrome b5-like heme/steroid binding domain-containing protein n=1 Tax=Cantharellus anzutake TaxID=1750568 RepID=UPI001903CF0D|nr:cytochrome b5-like heme/steroid binding domain-containing protein [Cantharellus anzutake]KAF8333458.1 cytochrome b5-like heme/steroid binding domain-containing protein [Cantharellus anzutake]